MRTDGSIRTSYLDRASLILVIVGALDWGLTGLGNLVMTNWNVATLSSAGSRPSKP